MNGFTGRCSLANQKMILQSKAFPSLPRYGPSLRWLCSPQVLHLKFRDFSESWLSGLEGRVPTGRSCAYMCLTVCSPASTGTLLKNPCSLEERDLSPVLTMGEAAGGAQPSLSNQRWGWRLDAVKAEVFFGFRTI